MFRSIVLACAVTLAAAESDYAKCDAHVKANPMPACTAALLAAETDCGAVTQNCAANSNGRTTCTKVEWVTGENMADTDKDPDNAPFAFLEGGCSTAAECTATKGKFTNVECEASATACPSGRACVPDVSTCDRYMATTIEPVCTAALLAAEKDCTGTVPENCAANTGEKTTCATLNFEKGENTNDDPTRTKDAPAPFAFVHSVCTTAADCIKAKGTFTNVVCEASATACSTGKTCPAGADGTTWAPTEPNPHQEEQAAKKAADEAADDTFSASGSSSLSGAVAAMAIIFAARMAL